MANDELPVQKLARLSETDTLITIETVVAVNDDGTVSLRWGNNPAIGIPCSSSYSNRQVGDVVRVDWDGPIVIGTTGTTDPQAQVNDDLERLGRDVVRAEKIRTRYDWGTSPPGGNFIKATEVWFDKDSFSNGRLDQFFVVATDPGGGSDPGNTETKDQVILFPNAKGSWRTNGQTDDDFVLQGDWTGRGNWEGGWFFGTAIPDVCAGRSVQKITLRVARRDDGSGWSSSVPARINLHSHASKTNPTAYSGTNTHNVPLTPGQVATYETTAGEKSALISGAALGFMVSGSGTGHYMKLSGLAGRVDIHFND